MDTPRRPQMSPDAAAVTQGLRRKLDFRIRIEREDLLVQNDALLHALKVERKRREAAEERLRGANLIRLLAVRLNLPQEVVLDQIATWCAQHPQEAVRTAGLKRAAP